jgi:actin-related protein 10
LVVDCGYADTQILPIAENYLLIDLCDALNIGTKTIHDELEKNLNIKNDDSESLVEDIKVKCCFVRNFKRSQRMASSVDTEPTVDCDYYLPNHQVLKVAGRFLLFIFIGF